MQRSKALKLIAAIASIAGSLPRSVYAAQLGASQNMPQTVETLLHENIFNIFGEHNAEKRRAKIAALWAEDGVFIVVSH